MALTLAPAVTGYSGFWANILCPTQGPGTYSMNNGRYNAPYYVARLFKKRAMADARGALAALIGAAAGGAALVQWKREQGPNGPSQTVPIATGVGELGGNRVMETVNSINRVTTAADVTELKKWFSPTALLEAGITYSTVVGNSLTDSRGMQAGGTGRF